MIFRNETTGKVIGKLTGNTLKKNVRKSKHLFQKTNSWAIQDSLLKQLADNVRIEIFDKEEGILYVTSAKEFRDNCDYFTFGKHGLQGYLPLDYFRVEK